MLLPMHLYAPEIREVFTFSFFGVETNPHWLLWKKNRISSTKQKPTAARNTTDNFTSWLQICPAQTIIGFSGSVGSWECWRMQTTGEMICRRKEDPKPFWNYAMHTDKKHPTPDPWEFHLQFLSPFISLKQIYFLLNWGRMATHTIVSTALIIILSRPFRQTSQGCEWVETRRSS